MLYIEHIAITNRKTFYNAHYYYHDCLIIDIILLVNYYFVNLFEVSLRNAIVNGLKRKYKQYSILNDNFVRALSDKTRKELVSTINEVSGREYSLQYDENHKLIPLRINIDDISPGKVIAGLKFVFWENMLSTRHCRSWSDNYKSGFQQLLQPKELQSAAYEKIRDKRIGEIKVITERVRTIRNRVSHHEPIFDTKKCDLNKLYTDIKQVLYYISSDLQTVLNDFSRIDELLKNKPS